MSAKWRRIQTWDAEHLTGWLTPVRVLMHWLSSIKLAVILLVFVALYAILASVPVGMLALAPTYAFYALTLAVAAFLPAAVGVAIARAATASAGRAPRFLATVLVGLGAAIAGAWAWSALAWPALRYDPIEGAGVRFFADFARQYQSTTVRRLPGVEMTELEFYSWWPLTGALLLFCGNLIFATIRRIEFNFKNLGVLTVHTGIITIALGTVMYASYKVEGDTILLAAPPMPGAPQPGPTQTAFYDNTQVVLNVAQHLGMGGRPRWEQRAIDGLPRYNTYALDAGAGPDREFLSALESHDAHTNEDTHDQAHASDDGRTLDIAIPEGDGRFVDPDLAFRVVGYAPQVELVPDWARAERPIMGDANPLRELELYADLPPSADGTVVPSDRPVFRFTLLPNTPARRTSDNAVLGIEYEMGADADRWRALAADLPPNTNHALVVNIPGSGPVVVPARVGQTQQIPGTDLTITTTALHPQPPFPIITPGYENATSSVAIVRIETAAGDSFERWLYFRFPEIDQDLRGAQSDGRPNRVDADRSIIDITYLDASRLQVHLDERPDGTVRSIVRQPGGAVRVAESLESGRLKGVIPGIDLALARRWDHAELVRAPVVIPPAEQRSEDLGTHAGSALAVEISSPALAGWSRVEWIPFSRYLGVGEETDRTVTLPDGRSVRLAFGRRQHRLPGFGVRMVDFEMIAYDHRGAPRDYQSVVRVEPGALRDAAPSFEAFDHTVKLNAPLRAPDHWREDAPWVSNAARRIMSGFSPNQFKLSQAGWDQQGWTDTQRMADAGELDRPFARFTILGVGNNPGIHVVALGGILMSVGIPWAFYVKPWLVRREKRRLQREVAAGAHKTRPAHTEPKTLEKAVV